MHPSCWEENLHVYHLWFLSYCLWAWGGGVSFYRCPVSSAHAVSVQITLSDVGHVYVQWSTRFLIAGSLSPSSSGLQGLECKEHSGSACGSLFIAVFIIGSWLALEPGLCLPELWLLILLVVTESRFPPVGWLCDFMWKLGELALSGVS